MMSIGIFPGNPGVGAPDILAFRVRSVLHPPWDLPRNWPLLRRAVEYNHDGWKTKRVLRIDPIRNQFSPLSRLPACWADTLAPFTSDPESDHRVVAPSFRSLTVGKKLYVRNL